MEKEKPSGDWMSESDSSLHSSEWFGAIFYYLIALGKPKFNVVYSAKFRRRNIWTGYLLKLIFLTAIIWLAIITMF